MKILLTLFVLLFSTSVFAEEDKYSCRSHKVIANTIVKSEEGGPDGNFIFEFIINHETKTISFLDKFVYDNTNKATSLYQILIDQSFNVNEYFYEQKVFRAYADRLGEIVIFRNDVVITFSIPDVGEDSLILNNAGSILSYAIFAKCHII